MTNICKICLFTNIKMYVITNTDLQDLYENLTKIKIHSKDTYQSVCYLCHMRMKQCLKLKQQAIQTDKLLKEALENSIEIKTPTTFRLTTSHLITLNIDPDLAKVEVKNENIKTENEDISTDMYTSDLDLETIKENDPNIKESRSDSEDDIPLKNISSKMLGKSDSGIKSIKRKRDRKINAKEILLSTEEQLQEMTNRSKSENYLNSPYKCDLCYKGFVEPVAFEKHKDKHDKISGPYKCNICHLRYPSSKSLRAHTAATHARRYQCADCTHRAHTRNQAIEHEKWHKGHTYSCQLCGLKFSKPSTHLTHMRKRHAGAHVCRLCGDSFYRPRGLHMHLSKAHRRDEPNSNPPADCACKDCDIQFSNKDAFTRHLLITNKHTLFDDDSHCKVCDTQTTNQSAHERMHAQLLKRSNDTSCRTVSDFRVSCQQCEANFSSRSQLQNHIKRVHLGIKYNKNIVCETCGKKCTSAAALLVHQRRHTGERPFSCPRCPARFSRREYLRVHGRSHSGERPYACALCGHAFTQKPALNRHYRVHTGARPYACHLCTKSFSQSNSLKIHINTVHLKMPKTKKNKDDSDINKSSAAALLVHQRRHTGERPFSCPRCPARFSRREYLRVHGRSHSGERPYACALCGHAFTQKPALNRHYRVHTGARPYACHLCTKSFSQSNSLKIHINTVHLKMPKTKKNKDDSDINKSVS